jgi:hypothetical protein
MSDIDLSSLASYRSDTPQIIDVQPGFVNFTPLAHGVTGVFRTLTLGSPVLPMPAQKASTLVFAAFNRPAALQTDKNQHQEAMVGLMNLSLEQRESFIHLTRALTGVMDLGEYLLEAAYFAYPAHLRTDPVFRAHIRQIRGQFGPHLRTARLSTHEYDASQPLLWSMAVTPLGSRLSHDIRFSEVRLPAQKA